MNLTRRFCVFAPLALTACAAVAAAQQRVQIAELAALMQDVTGYRGTLAYDTSKPDGMARKVVDGSRIHALGWRPRIELRQGLTDLYAWYLRQLSEGRPIRGLP